MTRLCCSGFDMPRLLKANNDIDILKQTQLLGLQNHSSTVVLPKTGTRNAGLGSLKDYLRVKTWF